jgi:glutaryl-CoA dehydrogenase
VPCDTAGFNPKPIHGKLGLRSCDTAEIALDDVVVPTSALLGAEGDGIKVALSALDDGRMSLAASCTGLGQAAVDSMTSYAKQREQFGRPIAGFQLTQRKLADMVVEVNRSGLLALTLGRLKDAGTLHPSQVSLGKFANVRGALDVARTARTVLGANGITLEYPVMRHASNLETVLTYEGTEEVHALTIGNALTGLNAFR